MLITNTEELERFCESAAMQDYVTVDTEFLRERTYFSKLCLVQIGYPGLSNDQIALIDPLAKGISLLPLKKLFENKEVTKVFHAARQDLEIFWHDLNVFPEPFFDTQIAAMVCGFGDQVGYETLVRRVAKGQMDKSSRFTDWSQRPLSRKQLDYAANDVTYLREIYEKLCEQITQDDRMTWVQEEMETLLNPALYDISPQKAWQRVRLRNTTGRSLLAVMKLAEFRERYAQTKNIPRARVYKDDALIELASTRPLSQTELGKSRLLNREARNGDIASGILKAVEDTVAVSNEDLPKIPKPKVAQSGHEAAADLLRVLLKAVSEREKVASKLIATAADLEAIARGDADVLALRGWRKAVFGDAALKILSGDTALRVKKGRVELIELID